MSETPICRDGWGSYLTHDPEYSVIAGNYYCKRCQHGMGNDYYKVARELVASQARVLELERESLDTAAALNSQIMENAALKHDLEAIYTTDCEHLAEIAELRTRYLQLTEQHARLCDQVYEEDGETLIQDGLRGRLEAAENDAAIGKAIGQLSWAAGSTGGWLPAHEIPCSHSFGFFKDVLNAAIASQPERKHVERSGKDRRVDEYTSERRSIFDEQRIKDRRKVGGNG